MNKNLLGILGSCQRDCIFHGPLKEAKSFGACASKKDDSFKSNQWHQDRIWIFRIFNRYLRY